MHVIAPLLYRTPRSTLGYDTVSTAIRRTLVMLAVSNFAFEIAAKLWLLD